MILTCQGCGGLYATNMHDRIAGTLCSCVLPRRKLTERPEVRSGEWMDELERRATEAHENSDHWSSIGGDQAAAPEAERGRNQKGK